MLMPLEHFLRHLPSAFVHAHTRMVVGFSGGMDSTVLLHALLQAFGTRVHAVHVHHGLQADADAWAAQCSDVCRQWQVALDVVHVQVTENGHGLEAAARDARHAAFAGLLQSGDAVVLAHHQDDQAETFLLHALRGSGPDGLSAMPAWQARGDTFVWRPLLDVPRAQLEDYARAHALTWIEDPSNASTRFDRNYLRNTVFPLLQARWPQAAAALAHAAELQSETRVQHDVRTAQQLDACRLPGADLSVDALMRFAVQDRARMLRAWVNTLGLPPLGRAHLQHIERDVLAARHDAEPAFNWGNAQILRWRDVLHASLRAAPMSMPAAPWDGQRPYPLPDGRQWRLSLPLTFPQAYTVVSRKGGERIQLPGRRHRTEVKKLLQAMGVPVWQRKPLMLLVDASGEVHAIPGLAMSDTLSKWLQAQGAELVIDAKIDPATLD